MIELFYRCRHYGKTHRLSTWRTNTGAEVDAVVETPDEVIPVEIKWTNSPQRKDIRHLDTFINLHQEIAFRGYLICRVDKPRQMSENIIATPWDQY